MDYNFGNLHEHPHFWTVMIVSLAGWVTGMAKGFSTSKEWLLQYFPTAPRVAIFVFDLIIFVFIGGYFGSGIYDPQNFYAAAAAGFTWPLALGALTTKE